MGIPKKEKGTSMTLQFKKATHLEKNIIFYFHSTKLVYEEV